MPAGGDQGGLARSPRLGLEFWQNGAPAAMSLGESGGKDVVTVTMKPGPFEFRFPKQGKDVAVQVCAWNDDSNRGPALLNGCGPGASRRGRTRVRAQPCGRNATRTQPSFLCLNMS